MKSKLIAIIFSIFSMLTLNISNLEAGGWGCLDEVIEYEGVDWNTIYFDMNELNFTAHIPGYSGTILKDGLVCLNGEVSEDVGYIIITSYYPDETLPTSKKEFVKLVKNSNLSYAVNSIDVNKSGAKWGLDLTPKNAEYTAFWRFFVMDGRLIKMGSDDADEARREYFFNSLHINN